MHQILSDKFLGYSKLPKIIFCQNFISSSELMYVEQYDCSIRVILHTLVQSMHQVKRYILESFIHARITVHIIDFYKEDRVLLLFTHWD